MPVVVVIFALLPARRAVICAFLFAWMFLPNASIPIPMFSDYTKMTATCAGVFAATLIFNVNSIQRFRPKLLDVAMIVYCLCPFATSILNGLGAYDGLSTALRFAIGWGMPYFLGRLYFSTPESMRELVIGVFIGGLVYVPLCLYEIRMSPQLHHMVYGFHPHVFAQTVRLGGWRPVVFMQHGLMVAMWMCVASIFGVALWFSGSLKRLGPFPMVALVPPLVATTVFLKSTGSLVLLAGGIAIVLSIRLMRHPLPLWSLCALPILYIVLRGGGFWSGENLVGLSESVAGEERAASLQFRIDNEDSLAEKARRQIVFGWGGWGRSRVFDEETGTDISVADGQWIITFGLSGLVGLSSLVGVVLGGPLALHRRVPPRLWPDPACAPCVAVAVALGLWMIDNLFNAMFNPIFIVMAGGLGGLAFARARRPSRPGGDPPFGPRQMPVVYSR